MNELRFAFFAMLAASALGCVEPHRPPSATPTASSPAPRDLPCPEGPANTVSPAVAQVTIETDVPARVERLFLSDIDRRTHREEVCTSTPCTITLPYGDHELIFQGRKGRQGKSIISVQKPAVVVRHTLGHQQVDLLAPLGGFFALTGAVMLGVAWAMVDGTHHRYSASGRNVAIAGASSLALGGILVLVAPTSSHDGRTTQSSLSSPAPSSRALTGATVSASVRF